jgi:hypothetical protein
VHNSAYELPGIYKGEVRRMRIPCVFSEQGHEEAPEPPKPQPPPLRLRVATGLGWTGLGALTVGASAAAAVAIGALAIRTLAMKRGRIQRLDILDILEELEVGGLH